MADRFTFFESFAKSTRKLPPEDFKAVMLAIFDYAFEGETTESFPSEWAESVYELIIPVIKNGKTNQQNGEKGGRPKKAKEEKAPVSESKKGGFTNPKSDKEYGEGEGKGKGVRNKDLEKEEGQGEDNTPHTPHGGKGAVKYSDDPELDQAVKDFIEHRKKLRKPMSDKAIELLMDKCAQLAPGDIIGQVKLINTAIERGWQTVYPPDDSKTRSGRAKGGGMDYLMSEMSRIKREQEVAVNDTG